MSAPLSPADRLAVERRRLDDLVRSGGDTSQVRRDIEQLEGEVARETTRQATLSARNSQARDATVSREVTETAEVRLAAIIAAVAPLSLPDGASEQLGADLSEEHRAAISAMIVAQQAVRASASRLDIAGTAIQTLRLRGEALEQQRTDMAKRRSRGDQRPDDGQELRLLELDLESLKPLDGAAGIAFTAASDSHAQLQAKLEAADARLTGVEALVAGKQVIGGLRAAGAFATAAGRVLDEQVLRMDHGSATSILQDVVAEAVEADSRMLQLLDRIAMTSARAGRPDAVPWGPSPRLQQAIRDLAVRRGT